jgi:hypothetical protein
MDYQECKNNVLAFFENHVYEYLIPDLEVLNNIQADANGRGGCTIPQAMTTFAAIDLFGFLIDPNPQSGKIKMHMMPFLKNPNLFPAMPYVQSAEDFFNSFRDDIRSVMSHRFFLINYDISKLGDEELIVENNGRRIFNVSKFTKLVIDGINKLYHDIKNDQFLMPGDQSNEMAVRRFLDRIELLKQQQSVYYQSAASEIYPTLSSTTVPQTTSSLG